MDNYVYTEMVKHMNKTLNQFNVHNPETHRFDNVTRFCIYCHIGQYEQHINPTPCKRIMEPFDERDNRVHTEIPIR